jgi:hypothetical protein
MEGRDAPISPEMSESSPPSMKLKKIRSRKSDGKRDVTPAS